MADISNEKLVSLNKNYSTGKGEDVKAGLKGVGDKMTSEDRKSTGYNDLFTDISHSDYNYEENGQALMLFFKKLFGIRSETEESKYVDGTYEEFLGEMNKDNSIDVDEANVLEGVEGKVVLPSEENKMSGYKDKLLELASDKELAGFDNKDLTDQITFKQEGGKFQVILPKELMASYSSYKENLGDDQEDIVLSGLKEFISAQKASSASLDPSQEGASQESVAERREEVPKTLLESVNDAKDFSDLNSARDNHSDELEVSGRRQREAILGNRSHLISAEEKMYKKYTLESSKEKGSGGHYNQEIAGTNKLIQRWADKHGATAEFGTALTGETSDRPSKDGDEVSKDPKFEKIDIEDSTQGIGKLCAENPDLKGLVEERNRLSELRDMRIEKYDRIAENQLDYAKAKTIEQYHQSAYGNGAKDLSSAAIKQGNLAHYFTASKHADVFGSVNKEIEQLSPDKDNAMTAKGLKGVVDTAYENMSVEAKASMHKVDIFKVKLDGKMLSGGGNPGAEVLMYAQKMPKVFSAMLSEKVGAELDESASTNISSALDKMVDHSDELKTAKINREELRSNDNFKSRGNAATNAMQSVSDSMAEFSSGVSNNSKIAGQKTWNAGVTAVDVVDKFGKALDQKIDEMGKAIESLSDGVDQKVTEGVNRAADFAKENSGGNFHDKVAKEREGILGKLKNGKGKGKEESTTSITRSDSSSTINTLSSAGDLQGVMDGFSDNSTMIDSGKVVEEEQDKGKGR